MDIHEASDCMRIKFKYRSNQPPWWDNECYNLKQKCKLLRCFRRTNRMILNCFFLKKVATSLKITAR